MNFIDNLSNEVNSFEVANSGSTYISYFISCENTGSSSDSSWLLYPVNIGPKVEFFTPEGYNTPPRCPTK